MLDNASFHTSKDTKEKLINLGLNAKFLPPYSPILAPVEQFFKLLKSEIESYNFENRVKLKTKEGIELVHKTCSDIKIFSLKPVWNDFVKTAYK